MKYEIAADTGGTFTDVVSYDRDANAFRFGKALTTYRNLVEGVLSGVDQMAVPLAEVGLVKHGTTHIINAFVQRKGAKTALVTTRGFRDVLEIGRANRPVAFDLHYSREAPLVPRTLAFEVSGRLDPEGGELEPLNEAELRSLGEELGRKGVEAVAVSFLNAYMNPEHEATAARILSEQLPGAFVTTGTELTREWYEFERASTAVANGYVGPRAADYLERFKRDLGDAGFSRTFYMMASHGGVLSLARAARQPVGLLESGPVGGCIGAGVYARALGRSKVVAFDMGGTTAKCAILEDGRFEVQPTYYVGGYETGFPIRSPILDIVEVGAGGGSIAAVDAHGRLHVGPRSAGAEPGPVAFGRGGVEPTVTDANLVLGRIGSGTFMGGALKLDVEASREVIAKSVAEPLGYSQEDIDVAASGILALATATMAGAIKEITIERGLDVRDFDLFVFGGGGPLHGASLARELHIPRVVVPPQPGNFSALGMLLAEPRIDETRTFLRPLAESSMADVQAVQAEMAQLISETLKREFGSKDVAIERAAELRYRGQKHSLRVMLGDARTVEHIRQLFDEAYLKRYGHADPTAAVEFVALRSTGSAEGNAIDISSLRPTVREAAGAPKATRSIYYASRKCRILTPVFSRDELPLGFSSPGPAIVEDYGSTIVVEPDDRFSVGEFGEITIYCEQVDHAGQR